MFGIGGSEFLIIAVIVVMLFGPDKLPKFARTVGKFMSEFKRYQAMMESTIRAEMYLTDKPDDPFKKAGEYQDKLRAEKEAEGADASVDAEPADGEPADGEPADAGSADGGTAQPDLEAADAEPAQMPAPAVTVAAVVDGLEFDEDGEMIHTAEDVGWVPGTPDAPRAEPAEDAREEAEERP